MSNFQVKQNKEYGYFSIDPLPKQEELNEFYNTNYYDQGTYSTQYTEEEKLLKVIPAHEIEMVTKLKWGRILDIGCGEGYILDYFHKKNWNVLGLDFSHDGISRHFPHLVSNVQKGDVYKSLNDLIEKGEKFDVIVCNNVLEHVIDPLTFLEKFKSLCNETTVVRIQVPNDFSWFQNKIWADDLIQNQYWLCPPAHLHYFNSDSLIKVLNTYGYEQIELLGDYPIEMFLLNPMSNYNKDKNVGSWAHKARVYFDSTLFRHSFDKLMEFRKGCGKSSVCRNIIVYCKVK